ncbi:putative ATP-dependent RNA helicase [Pacmanvirus S19]|nr:putative ATP-dependent RNA helicase [Pacmanvirus S19]
MEIYKGFLTQNGFIVPVKTLKLRFKNSYPKLLEKLTIVHRQKIGPPKIAKLYKIAEYNGISCMHLPRTMIKSLVNGKILTTVDVILPKLIHIPAKLHTDLYDNQNLIIDHLCQNVFTEERIENGTATAILNLRAGMGKTFVAAGLIDRLKVKTLYIVPKRPLMLQCVKDLRSCLYPDEGNPNIIIGQYGVTKKRDKSSNVLLQDVTVIVINSAVERGADFFAKYSLIILDEVHSYCSEQRREIFRKATSRLCLGMSATTEDRNDGFDPIAHKELAVDGIIRAESIPKFTYEDIKFNCKAKIINYSGPPEHTLNLSHETTGVIFTPYMHKQFMRDPFRLKLAVDELITLYDWRGPLGEQHSIYIFAEEIKLLNIMLTALNRELTIRNRQDIEIIAPEATGIEMFTGGLKDEQVTKISTSGRVLCSTYGYAGTGISISKMSCIMFLTPRRANMKQIIARILRRGSDMNIPRNVIDIVDNKTCLRYQFGSRLIAYEHYGFEIEKQKVKYTDIVV